MKLGSIHTLTILYVPIFGTAYTSPSVACFPVSGFCVLVGMQITIMVNTIEVCWSCICCHTMLLKSDPCKKITTNMNEKITYMRPCSEALVIVVQNRKSDLLLICLILIGLNYNLKNCITHFSPYLVFHNHVYLA